MPVTEQQAGEARALGHLRAMLGTAACFRDGQWRAIQAVVERRGRLLVVEKTGWGKSIVYFIATRMLRDSGYEIIFTGIRQRIEVIVATAVQEDVAVVGLSILSGAHLALTTRVIEGLRAAGAADIAVVVGGTIPPADVPRLRAATEHAAEAIAGRFGQGAVRGPVRAFVLTATA